MFSFKNNQDVTRINEVAHPEAGVTYPAHKRDNERDSLGDPAEYIRNTKPVTDAKEQLGVAKRCLDYQLGRGTPSGGKQGDATTQPNSGCGCDED
jgi:hypothetical protein